MDISRPESAVDRYRETSHKGKRNADSTIFYGDNDSGFIKKGSSDYKKKGSSDYKKKGSSDFKKKGKKSKKKHRGQ